MDETADDDYNPSAFLNSTDLTSSPAHSNNMDEDQDYLLSTTDTITEDDQSFTSSSEESVQSVPQESIVKSFVPREPVSYAGTTCWVRGYSAQLSPVAAAKLLFSISKHDPVARTVANRPQDNCTFVYDTQNMLLWNDALSDGNGRWPYNRGRRVSKHKHSSGKPVEFHRWIYTNATEPTYHRLVVRSPSYLCTYVLVQYWFDGKVKPFVPEPHGNRKETTAPVPYSRTFASTKQQIKQQGRQQSYQKLKEERSTFTSFSHPDQPISNARQILNLTAAGQPKDSIEHLTLLCREQLNSPNCFVREVTSAPRLFVHLSSDRQLSDLVRFCTNPEKFCVLGVDTTFNCGRFYVTVVTYRHLMLTSERCTIGAHPVMIGAIFIHHHRDESVYFSIAASLLRFAPRLVNLQAYGTDGDGALCNAMGMLYPKAVHLRCDLHLRDNVAHKLSKLGLPSVQAASMLTDIFGKKTGTIRQAGLTDAPLRDYDRQAQVLLEKWRSTGMPGIEFAKYVEKRLDIIRDCLSLEVRLHCGLRLDPYTQNANECANSVIKKWIEEKQTLNNFVDLMQGLVDKQDQDIQLTVLGRTPGYCIHTDYSALLTTVTNYWDTTKVRTDVDRAEALKRIHSLPLKVVSDTVTIDMDDSDHDDSRVSPARSELSGHLSDSMEVPIESSDEYDAASNAVGLLMDVSADQRKWLVDRVIKLLQTPTLIAEKPGSGARKYMVASLTRDDFLHEVVTAVTDGKLTCSCDYGKAGSVCAHAIGVAIRRDTLQAFADWTNLRPAKISLNNHNVSSKVGSKARKNTEIRKGSSKPSAPVTKVLADGRRVTFKSASQPIPRTRIAQTTPVKLKTAARKTVYSPSAYTCEPVLLSNCPAQVTTCSGCLQRFHPTGLPLSPPLDLIAVSCAARPYKDPKTGERKMSKIKNCYFHLDSLCIKKLLVNFCMDELIVRDEVKATLEVHHKRHLSQLMGHSCDL